MELLKGKVAMVTGGTRGIGFAIVKTYLDNGACVALCGSRQETIDKALTTLKELNPDYKVIGLCPNLQDSQEVEKAVNTTKETFGRFDIMVNNAGISVQLPFTWNLAKSPIVKLIISRVFDTTMDFLRNRANQCL